MIRIFTQAVSVTGLERDSQTHSDKIKWLNVAHPNEHHLLFVTTRCVGCFTCDLRFLVKNSMECKAKMHCLGIALM